MPNEAGLRRRIFLQMRRVAVLLFTQSYILRRFVNPASRFVSACVAPALVWFSEAEF